MTARRSRSPAEPAPLERSQSDRGSPLDAALTFDKFIVGKSNALVHAAAMRVIDALPGAASTCNPLFVHSAAGLGKTHLLNAIAWRIRETQPERKVLFITAERFMYHFIDALRSRDVITFKDYFQSIDVLAHRRLPVSAGQVDAAGVLPHLQLAGGFEAAGDRRRRRAAGPAREHRSAHALAADGRPRRRHRGRRNTTCATASWKRAWPSARRRDPALAIGADVVEFIANKVTGGGRELEGALNRVIASQQLTHARMTIDLAAMVLRDLAQPSDGARVRIEDILKLIGRHYNIARADILSPRRARSIVRPRQVGMYLAKKLTPRSLPEIGRRFGGRDHSTVLHAVRKIEELMLTDDRLAGEVALLIRLIEQQ